MAIFLAGFFAIPAPAAGEEEPVIIRGYERGFVAGGNLATVDDSRAGATPRGWTPGLGIGLRTGAQVHPRYGLQTELLYVQRGMTQWVEEVREDTTLHYVQIPLFLRLGVPINEDIAARLVFGPTGSILLGRQVRGPDGPIVDPYLEELEPIDVGFAVSAGANFTTRAGAFSVELRYDRGLTSMIYLDESGDTVVNSSLSIFFGFHFLQ